MNAATGLNAGRLYKSTRGERSVPRKEARRASHLNQGWTVRIVRNKSLAASLSDLASPRSRSTQNSPRCSRCDFEGARRFLQAAGRGLNKRAFVIDRLWRKAAGRKPMNAHVPWSVGPRSRTQPQTYLRWSVSFSLYESRDGHAEPAFRLSALEEVFSIVQPSRPRCRCRRRPWRT